MSLRDTARSLATVAQESKGCVSLGDESRNLVHLCDVEGYGAGSVLAMLMDEFHKPLFPSTNNDDGGSFLDKARCERFSNPACRPNNEDLFVGKGHDERFCWLFQGGSTMLRAGGMT